MHTLLVASTGGHLQELHALAPRLAGTTEVSWATFDTPQSRTLLRGERVHHVPFAGPRDLAGTLRGVPVARRVLREERIDRVVSTGASIALSFLPLAAMRGIETHYVESAARNEGPSLTGRLLQGVPQVQLHTQSQAWAHGRWSHGGSVFDAFSALPVAGSRALLRVLVTVGTMPYGFRALIDRLRAVLPGDVEVRWQTGATDVSDLPIDASPQLTSDELIDAMTWADVVVTHAGVGTAINVLDAGRRPVLVPRSRARGEHVDDHQRHIAAELGDRGLAVSTPVEGLSLAHLEAAATARVIRAPTVEFALARPRALPPVSSSLAPALR